MKPTVKSSIILIVTLLIGIAIGYELNGMLFRYRFDAPKMMRRPEGFVNHFENIIKPDEAQKKKLRETILKYHTRIEDVSNKNMQRVGQLIDSMNTELRSQLTKEQAARLDGMIQNMKKFPPPDKMSGPGRGPGYGPDRGPGGPGFGPPPGDRPPADDRKPEDRNTPGNGNNRPK